MVVVIDEQLDLLFEITRQEVVFQQYAVLQRLVPTLYLALCLRMIRCTANVAHLIVLDPISKFAGDVTRSIVREQSGLMNDIDLITARCLQSQLQRFGHASRLVMPEHSFQAIT